MRVLGIETSSDLVSVAMVDGSGVLAEMAFGHRMQLSRDLLPRVQEVLAMAGSRLEELEGIAVSVGPGSFTGLRIGVTAAKTLAYARKIPAAAVGTLEAIAYEHPAPAPALLASIKSASATEVFAALYQWNEGRLEPRAAEMLVPGDQLIKMLQKSPLDVLIVGEVGPHREALVAALGSKVPIVHRDTPPRASTIAVLGRRKLLAGEGDPVHALAPRYLRPSAAEARRAGAVP